MADCQVECTRLSGATPDCPMSNAGLSDALGNSSRTASNRWDWWREATGLSGVTSGLSSAKACSANGQLWCQIQRLGTTDSGTGLSSDPPDWPVCHREQ
jgi:hypothetical protein